MCTISITKLKNTLPDRMNNLLAYSPAPFPLSGKNQLHEERDEGPRADGEVGQEAHNLPEDPVPRLHEHAEQRPVDGARHRVPGGGRPREGALPQLPRGQVHRLHREEDSHQAGRRALPWLMM